MYEYFDTIHLFQKSLPVAILTFRMRMFDTIKKNFQQENDDVLYEYVMEEMESKEPLKGLWAKAIAHSEGNNNKAKSLYIQYRVQALKDECKSAGVSF